VSKQKTGGFRAAMHSVDVLDRVFDSYPSIANSVVPEWFCRHLSHDGD